MVLISAYPNQLHIYNANTNADTVVVLPDLPANLSISPDGLHAAVALTNSVVYVNLQTPAIEKTFSNVAVNGGIVVLSPTYVYVFPSYVGSIISIELDSGESTTAPGFTYASGGRYDLATQSVYST
jgi:hypothetical protein